MRCRSSACSGAEVGAIYRDLHLDHGVEMLLGAAVESFEGDGSVERVRTQDGRTVACDAVVVGIGATPRAVLAAAAGLAVGNGVLVDGRLETSVPGIFAAGDVANHLHPTLGRLRVEHWDNALHQGPAAARGMLGSDEPYTRTPVLLLRPVRRRHGVLRLRGGLGSRRLPRRSRRRASSSPSGSRDGRVLAGMNVNVWDVAEPIQALIAGGHAWTSDAWPIPTSRSNARRARGGAVMNRLQQLHDAGVSIWLDTLSRDLLESGEFATLVDEFAVTGATSNPTIFAKAITGSDRYDDQLRALAAAGTDDGAGAVLRHRARRRPRRG